MNNASKNKRENVAAKKEPNVFLNDYNENNQLNRIT